VPIAGTVPADDELQDKDNQHYERSEQTKKGASFNMDNVNEQIMKAIAAHQGN
jgi:hypothetical protein